ncbi:glycerol-3-phosphate dehydrogenase/oxidase [Sphingobacterium lactis]|uniref:Glycerol-3-phosphate dehydrogenase n=1 Tax=Sphingobacterium lactis TaxID=797291 RepID=A0A1H6BEM1_9SPHI|nr:glycerol-3-phosphate dehydrogenase/oxidase [Sphingobacterium lactis]SEG59218.1 glycerol-3-phosphate dehydrogenase [Sphingobacterium lactis]
MLIEINRKDQLEQLTLSQVWDMVIIGGGATGLGTAVDAASRGFKVLLVEKYDFAKGTSSKSTKLVHGGVRYLANGDIKLVIGALRERGLIFKNAPHVSSAQSFVIPLYSTFDKLKYLVGLKLYDWLAGSLRIGKSVLLSKKEVVEKLPHIKQNGLKGGILYYDGQFDDARLAVNLGQTAVEHGATVLNYMEASDFHKNADGKINGVTVRDTETGQTYTIQAKTVINATGIFVDDILKLDTPNHKNLVRPSQGSHIVIDQKFLDGHDALMIPETSDGRVLFGVPWHGKVLLGTTDIPINEHEIEPRPMEDEINFILTTADNYLNPAPKREDILSIYAGLRPLAAPKDNEESTKEISRDHKLIHSASGLITITGGKWTTYRKMAEETVNMAISVGKLKEVPCRTKHLAIHGSTPDVYHEHWNLYGKDYQAIQQLIQENESLREHLVEGYEYNAAEVVWACRYEMIRKVEDFLARRCRLLLLDAKAAKQAAPKVASLMAQELGKSSEWAQNEVNQFNELADRYLL